MTWFFLSILIISIDQYTKHLAVENLKGMPPKYVIDNIFLLTYTENTGIAFGLFKNSKYFIIGLTIIISAALIYFLLKNPSIDKYLKISLSIIVGGAVSNLIDRLLRGYVIDFLDFRIWPVFNVSDVFVVTGTFILTYYILFRHEDKNRISGDDKLGKH